MRGKGSREMESRAFRFPAVGGQGRRQSLPLASNPLSDAQPVTCISTRRVVTTRHICPVRSYMPEGCTGMNNAKNEQDEGLRLVPTTVRMTADATAAIDEIAAEHHMSRAMVIRLAVDNRLVSYLGQIRYVDSGQGEQIQTLLGQVFTEMDRIRVELNRIGVNYNQAVRALNSGNAKSADLPVDAVSNLVDQFQSCSQKAGESLCRILA